MTDPHDAPALTSTATDHVEIRVGATPVNLAVVRAVAVHIAMRADFTIDAISDLELAVDECCSTVIPRALDGSVLTCGFSILPEAIVMRATVPSAEADPPDTSTFGWRVLTTLTNHVEAWVEQGPPAGQHFVTVELIKRRSGVPG